MYVLSLAAPFLHPGCYSTFAIILWFREAKAANKLLCMQCFVVCALKGNGIMKWRLHKDSFGICLFVYR